MAIPDFFPLGQLDHHELDAFLIPRRIQREAAAYRPAKARGAALSAAPKAA